MRLSSKGQTLGSCEGIITLTSDTTTAGCKEENPFPVEGLLLLQYLLRSERDSLLFRGLRSLSTPTPQSCLVRRVGLFDGEVSSSVPSTGQWWTSTGGETDTHSSPVT